MLVHVSDEKLDVYILRFQKISLDICTGDGHWYWTKPHILDVCTLFIVDEIDW